MEYVRANYREAKRGKEGSSYKYMLFRAPSKRSCVHLSSDIADDVNDRDGETIGIESRSNATFIGEIFVIARY